MAERAPDVAAQRALADASVAQRFSLAMNAATSPLGALTDFVHAGAAAGAIMFAGLVAASATRSSTVAGLTLAAACSPFVVAAAAAFRLRDARANVVAWLATLPFEVVNLNALLAGLGDTLEIELARGPLPARAELQPRLDAVSDDALLVDAREDDRVIVVRIGVIDSKRRPRASAHARWARFVAIVERVVVPLAASHGVVRVLVV